METIERPERSIVEYYAEHEGYKCGYCKSPDTNVSHGLWAHVLTVQDYQCLIDRGWRRSGCYCYKPTMNQTCCPQYTIKCEALDFKISKSQKKILKRMSKFLRNELTNSDADTRRDYHDNIDINNEVPNYSKHLAKAQKNASEIHVSSIDDEVNGRLSIDSAKAKPECSKKSTSVLSIDSVKTKPECSKTSTSVSSNQEQLNKSSNKNTLQKIRSEITDAVPCKKAKLLRIERKQNKLLAQGKSQSEIESIMKEKKQQNCVKTVEELFEEVLQGGVKKLELKLVRTAPMSSEYQKTSKKSYEIYKKYQTTIHGVPAEKVTEQQYTRFLVKSPLQMKLVRVMSDEFLSNFDVSANLYKKYQMAIHGDSPDECNQTSFYNFLVKSPLQSWIPNNGPPQGYGSFHEQYWLDNELIAVGVIDILPLCISSVYFFYDPAYSQLSLGTFSSLREVYLTRQLNKVASDLKYYYMGFYIHTCPKMRYKARMRPSKLLCPETYVWCDIEPCLAKLDKTKYSCLNDDRYACDIDGDVYMDDIDQVLILFNQIAMSYKRYREYQKPGQVVQYDNEDLHDEVKEYARLVGLPLARRMLLYRHRHLRE
ncbi:arginyl-tRNA--protein transferase 1 isoform X1 [Pseudomyrmex gracilis]|uniref:arginyl-tRNA--protein transferase 1 isoform X1 n=1 Tax=Pseudomyrmex gracilis TaxID=219809 RepID=UPI000994A36D|nr:arginyl-tRNA--protein transferase 1 isoform X1 [Pseudomyrmex gracilis]XP_020290236.1 arginyl-tRNA--protein transferase 1 isoform X1 [Pseudomyrmex gracilis]